MNTMRTSRLLLFISLLVVCSRAWGFEDPLKYPAIISGLAPETLLLDITRANDRLVAVGERGHIVVSDDNGLTWRQAQVPVRETLTAVDFPGGGSVGWAVGHSGVILVSRDGGEVWTEQFDGYQVNQLMLDTAAEAVEAKNLELASASEEDKERLQGELENLDYLLSDSQSFADGGPTRPFLDVCFINEEEGMAVGQFGLVVKTSDGGKTWTSPVVAIENPEGLHFNSILWADGCWFIGGERGFAARSLDNGVSWDVLSTPYDGSFFAVGADQRSVILLGLRGNAVISFDRGDSWETVDTQASASLTSVSFLADGRLLVSQYAPNLLISDTSRTELTPLPWKAGTRITAFTMAADGALITVGMGGEKRIAKEDFSLTGSAGPKASTTTSN